ncbi:hypothetical protein [Fodinicurvata sediminis]|uniref:hypothetical protein n=1 Tax=Fodinicurvata sediminis TaxID=1121832 RepID=UPI0003B6ABB7|nr:hypothetical protein [Fodinicurvata sediminis]
MSGVADAIGDAFDSVTDAIGDAVGAIGDAVSSVGDFLGDIGLKKILPLALAAGAAVFTGGAALGLAPLAGGWGAAVSGAVSQLGATGVLGSTLTGAITQAGYGALVGGAVSAVTGGDIMKGVQTGGLGGAISGGVMGGLGMATDPTSFFGMTGDKAAAANIAGPTELANQGSSFSGGFGGMMDAVNAANSGALSSAGSAASSGLSGGYGGMMDVVSAASGSGSSAGGGGGGLLSSIAGEGGWLERNGDLVGEVVSGVGKGLMSSSEEDAMKERMELRREMAEDERKWIEGNYRGVDPGAGYRTAARGQVDESPVDRWDAIVHGGGEYVYDRKQGRIVYQPRQQQQRRQQTRTA